METAIETVILVPVAFFSHSRSSLVIVLLLAPAVVALSKTLPQITQMNFPSFLENIELEFLFSGVPIGVSIAFLLIVRNGLKGRLLK